MAKPGKTDLKEQFIELRASGLSYAAIAEQLGISKPTLISWARELHAELRNARTMRMDELFERFTVAKTKRIEAFGKRLDAILAELDKRDLSTVRTETLLTVALKHGEMLRAEHEPLAFEGEASFLDLDDMGVTPKWPA